MRPGKIGILYANNMVRDNGYISEEDIIKAYLECSFEADEYDDELTFPNAIRTSFAKKYLIIRQITKESCPSIFEELNQLGVWHIFVLGDDASIIFNDFYTENCTDELNISWTSVLASTQFNKAVPKFWISQETEIAIIINKINNLCGNIATFSTSEDSAFTISFKANFEKALKTRYDISPSPLGEADTAFVVGLGDSAHAAKIQELCHQHKIVITNSAILEYPKLTKVLASGGIVIYFTDIQIHNRENIKLPQLFLKLAFEIRSIYPNEIKKTVYNSEFLDKDFYFDEENYIQLPYALAIIQSGLSRITPSYLGNKNRYLGSRHQLSQSIIGFTNSDYIEELRILGITEFFCAFESDYKPIYSHLMKTRQHNFDVFWEIVKCFGNNSQFSRPIQINIKEEDSNDNNTYRLGINVDGAIRYPIRLPLKTDQRHITMSLVLSLHDLQDSIPINNLAFNDLVDEIELCQDGESSYIYIFPYRTQSSKFGYTFVGTNNRLSAVNLNLVWTKSTIIVSNLESEYLLRKTKSESIKSAKAAIMSRNMSHNLGSHVMFYIKQKLQSVSKIINNDVLHNIITGSQLNIEELQKKLQNSANIELPFLVGLGRFINYLQERQDYIATVATNYIPARSTISFKDFIYDELKPDLRYERHKKDNSSSDNGWQPKNLLLDYIAYSEGYSKSDDIEIKFGEFNGHNPLDDTAKGDFQALRKFNVAVPGGVIGRQAIFSIVENIIRNAAKHSEHRSNGKLVLQLSLVDAENDFTGDFLTDKFRCMRKEKGSMESGESLVKLYQNHKDAFHILRIKLDMPNKKDDIEALVGKLGEDYVEEDGSMKETSKGLKEMRISAAWLRGHSIDTDIPTTEPPVLAVYSEPYDDTDKETISYYLCIPKPCKVAFVVEDMAKYTALNDEIKPFGCQIFEYVEQNEKNQDNKEAVQTFRNQIADYEIVCMDLEKGKRNCILPYISSRYITNSATTKSILDELKGIAKPFKGSDQERKNNKTQYAQIKAAIDSIYEKWFKETYGEVNHKLLIADDKTCEKHQTRNVKEDASQNNTANDLGVILRATGTAKKEDCENSVIYSTHFAGLYKAHCSTNDKDATKSGYELLQSGASIEAITGNNSTDRLIRQDEWNKEWKYKHLSAGLARVAIFDERIFGSFITEKNSNSVDHNKVSALLEKHKGKPMSKEDIMAALRNLNFKNHHAESLAKAIIKERQINWESFYEKYQKPEYNGQVAQTNYERRTWSFNIQADENLDRTMKILGYDAMIGDNLDWADENVHKQPIEIATFKDEDGEYKITLSAEGKKIFTNGNSRIFHYITIHQGILDKIYNVFGIKENEKEKYKVTHALHRFFSKPPLSKETEKKHKSTESFLPNFIIHSGRSKPNEKDMPQHQPFVQFAAIDHAVKDCKYTLVELLATAHYEQGSNNN